MASPYALSRRRAGEAGRGKFALILLLLLLAIAGLMCLPAGAPAIEPAGPARIAAIEDAWGRFTADRAAGRAARFEITAHDLSALALAEQPEAPMVFTAGAGTLTAYLRPRPALPVTVVIVIAPRLADGRLILAVRSARIGRLPIPASRVEAALREKSLPLDRALEGVRYLTVEPDRLILECDARAPAEPGRAPGEFPLR